MKKILILFSALLLQAATVSVFAQVKPVGSDRIRIDMSEFIDTGVVTVDEVLVGAVPGTDIIYPDEIIRTDYHVEPKHFVRTVTIDGIIYTDNGSHKTWSVKSLADGVVKTHIVIPDSISVDGLMNKVSSVSTGAFDGNTDIETVHLPDSLRFLSGNAFRNCTNLRQINIPRNCVITDRVFENCISLEEIVIKSGFNLVNGSRLFTGCTSLKRVVIEEGDYIGPHFLTGVHRLKNWSCHLLWKRLVLRLLRVATT